MFEAEGRSDGSEFAGRLAIIAGGELFQRFQFHVLGDEADRAVTHGDLDAAGVE